MTQRRPVRTYHDDSPWPHLELGPAGDRRYLEQIVKTIFAAGLNWQVVQSHWAAWARCSTTSTRPRWRR